MSQPIPYTRQFGFTDFSSSYPGQQQPGPALDAEYDAIRATTSGVLANLAIIQRDDGKLKNAIVTLDTLSPSVMYALGAGVIWLPRGAWTSATAYAVSDVIQNGSGSYVCAAGHVSAADFATDFATGAWVKLFDDAGSTPGDGTVTTAKLADGSVTVEKIGFSTLDITGNVRAATGLQAGTAPLGGLLHAKLDAGDVLVKVERASRSQGAVGYQIVGVTVTWSIEQATNSDDLSFWNDHLPGPTTLLRPNGGLDQVGHMRSTGTTSPVDGAGVALSFSANTGFVDSYDWAATAWRDLRVRGKTVTISASAVDTLSVSSSGVSILGSAKINNIDMGYLDIPQNAQNGAYTLVISDRGRHIYSKNTAGQTINIPTNASVGFPIGSAIAIINDGTNPVTVSASNIILKQAGTSNTGNRTIATHGLATLLKVGTDTWFISGSGVA